MSTSYQAQDEAGESSHREGSLPDDGNAVVAATGPGALVTPQSVKPRHDGKQPNTTSKEHANPRTPAEPRPGSDPAQETLRLEPTGSSIRPATEPVSTHDLTTEPRGEPSSYQEPGQASLLPPPDFKPFFVLIEEPETGEHYHPTVHYIFADDDHPDHLTSAALEAVEQTPDPAAPRSGDVTNDRFVIVDLSSDGKDVVATSSLSPDWQALQTRVAPVPSWGEEGNAGGNRGTMLRISGQESGGETRPRRQKLQGLEQVGVALKAFDERQAGLDAVLGTTNPAAAPQ